MGTVHAKETRSPPYKENAPHRRVDHEASESKEIHLEGIKARVDKVHINGLARTKDDIIADAIQDLFEAKDFQEVILQTHKVRTKLDSLGCFKNIGIFIDVSRGEKATDDGLEVTFNVKELNRVVGGISTSVGNNEGSVIVGMRAPNILGRGERVQVEYSYGSSKTNNFNVSFIKPLMGKANRLFTGSVYQTGMKWPSSGYGEVDTGLLLDYAFYSTPLLKHNVQWDFAVRSLSTLTKTAAFAIREQSGLSLKSALRHILSLDLRDETIFPTCGSFFQLTSELAGIGGNVGYIKNDVFVQTNYSIIEDMVLQAAFQAGFMNGIGTDMKIGLNDMFYLGGSQTLRGFELRGVGPHSEGNSLGSTSFWSGALHVFTPLPFRPGKGSFGDLFRTHLFVNVGNIGNFKFGSDMSQNFQQLSTNVRLAYGIGIAARIGQMARIELNYCFPVYFARSDKTHPGVQFGIGMQFL